MLPIEKNGVMHTRGAVTIHQGLSQPFSPFSQLGHNNLPTLTHQCPKLSFYFVHSQGALPKKLCTRKFLHAPSQYIAIINGSKNVHTPGAHLLKPCTRPWKCARRVQGAPLISDTAHTISLHVGPKPYP